MPAIHAQTAKSVYIEPIVNGKALGNTTGFLIRIRHSYYLVTNRHVCTGEDQLTGNALHSSKFTPTHIRIFHNSIKGLDFYEKKIESLWGGNERLWIEHPTLGARCDVVILRLQDYTNCMMFEYDLDNPVIDFSINLTETVSIIGYPFGKRIGPGFAVWSTGFIASEIEIDYDEMPVFLVDRRSRTGQSGSPVYAFRPAGFVKSGEDLKMYDAPVGKLLGIYSGRINRESDLGMVWKLDCLREIRNTCLE